MYFILENYLAFKAAHIIAVICWMAGLLYLPRLFVYHADAIKDGEADKTFRIMEYKLYYYIMHPSMLASYALGLCMFVSQPAWPLWMHIKLGLVLLMTVSHIMMGVYLRDFALASNIKTSKFFRVFNEIPSLLMVFIVILAVTKFI
jgi:putative membrane protein